MLVLQAHGVAAGIVADAEDLCTRDPQLQSRGYWTAITTAEGERFEFDGPPIRLSDRPGYVAGPGPLLGEHTEDVLRRVLGLTAEQIAELRAAGVVGGDEDVKRET